MVIDASGSARVPMDASRHELPRLQLRLRLLLVFAFYLAAGKLGLSVPYTSGNISPLWPASGVALGSVLLWGFEVWPAIALAAFLVNFFRPLPVMAGLGIALGNTSSALFGGYLLRRFAGFQPSLARMRDVLSLVLLGAVVSPIVAASIGVTTLFLTHVRAWSGPWSAWRVWWLGQAMGVLIVTPLYLIGRELVSFVRGHRLTEFVVLSAGLCTSCWAVFGGRAGIGPQDDVLAFVVFPFVIWAAIRFRVAGTAMAGILMAAFAVWGTAHSNGPFVEHTALVNTALMQLFIAVTSITGLILAGVIMERERAQEVVRAQAELLDAANDAIFVRSPHAKITFWNKGAERLFGWTKEEAIGKSAHEMLQTEFPTPFEEVLKRSREGAWEGDLAHTARDGTKVTVASSSTKLTDAQNNMVGWLTINTDVTQRRVAEKAARQLSARFVRMQDEERRRLARELHDSAGQTLAALAMNLAQFQGSIKPNAKEAQLLSDSQLLLKGLTKELRTISHLLHPPLLDEIGLPYALKYYIDGFAKRSGIDTVLELAPDFERLPPGFEIAIFRIVQECLTNIHLHSGSATAEIRLARSDVDVRLEVRDQGKGIPIEKRLSLLTAGHMGVGLRGMQERVAQLGGALDVQSGDSGTIVTALVPLSRSGRTPSDVVEVEKA